MTGAAAVVLAAFPVVNARADGPVLTLAEISADDRGLLRQAGCLGLRSLDLGERSPVYNLRTGVDLTFAELARIKAHQAPGAQGLAAASAAASLPADAKELVGVLERGADGENIFEPMGPLPADHAGYSLQGSVMALEGARVLSGGRYRLGVDLSAHNFLTRTNEPGGRVTQKFEDHQVALELRRGLKTSIPVELGAAVRLHHRDEGFLNGFIAGAESLFARGLGPQMINADRSGPHAVHGTVNEISVGGRRLREEASSGVSFGDIVLTGKAALSAPPPGSYIPSLAARLALNVAVPGPFSNGSSIGMGLSWQQKVIGPLYALWDARVVAPLRSQDSRGFELNPVSFGTTAGLELGLTRNTSVGAQFNYQQSAYRGVGLHPFDDTLTSVVVGLSHRWKNMVFRGWVKEDVNLFNSRPGGRGALGPHGDSDFAAGVGVGISF